MNGVFKWLLFCLLVNITVVVVVVVIVVVVVVVVVIIVVVVIVVVVVVVVNLPCVCHWEIIRKTNFRQTELLRSITP